MAVKVWQGEQQQRQDDLSKVDGTGRNRGWVFIVAMSGEISGANGTPMILPSRQQCRMFT